MDEPPLPPSATPGTLIRGKYRVERMLGEGGVGVVVEALHLDLSKRVAIKLLRPEWQTQELEARFAREARVAAGLPADHIAQVTDAGYTEAGECFLVMELLVGRDLADELGERDRIPIPEAVDLILQATAGVAEAHAAGLVHRDLKPANLFLVKRRDGRPNVKVLDFGLSKAPLREGETELTQTTSNFGTPQYMSPEQLLSAKHVDARSDQHALAMILFELCTGRLPYNAPSLTSLTVAIATEPPPSARTFCSDMPEELDIAIRRGLAKRPEDRYADVLGFARAIAPFGGDRAHEALGIIASALGSKAPPQSGRLSAPHSAPQSARVQVAGPAPVDPMRATVRISPTSEDDLRKTVPISAANDDDARATLRMPVDEDDDRDPEDAATVRMALNVDDLRGARPSREPAASGVPSVREPAPSTATPRRLAARSRSKIAGIVTIAVLALGLSAWAMGWLDPAPSGRPPPAASGAPGVVPPASAEPPAPPALPASAAPSTNAAPSPSAAPSTSAASDTPPAPAESGARTGKSPGEVSGGD